MNRRRGKRATAGWAAVMVVAAIGGCSTGKAADPSSQESTSADDLGAPKELALPAQVRVEVTGAHAFVWEGRQEIQITRAGAPDTQANLLSGGFLNPEPLPPDRRERFRWAFDLIGEYRDQPGTFTLSGQASPEGLASAALLIFMRVKDGSKPAVFDWDEVDLYEEYGKVVQPCTLEVGADYQTGGLHCPELSEEGGKSIALHVTWSQA